MNPAPLALALAAAVFALPAAAATRTLVDPKGDDTGPGSYTYPTGPEYKKGSFDVTEVTLADKGDTVEVTVTIATTFEDAWDSAKWPSPGNGFSLQMFQLYLDADGKAGSGEQNGLPGTNVTFADTARWEKVVILSPQANKELTSRVDRKAKAMKDKIVLPKKVSVKGKKLTAQIAKADLGLDVSKAGVQLLSLSNEGYDNEAQNGILTRTVNEFEGQHRFGGGDDSDVDANVIDCLAGAAKGGDDEKATQQAQLKFDAAKKNRAVLTMVKGG